jgi:hypothetical protein
MIREPPCRPNMAVMYEEAIRDEEWLGRGSGGADAAGLIDRLLARPAGSRCFRVVEREGGPRRLRLRYRLSRWRRPGRS